jgi:hypothetical protein
MGKLGREKNSLQKQKTAEILGTEMNCVILLPFAL